MHSYRRILALVALNADADAVARRAVQLARFHGGALALAAVVDYSPGFDCDQYPIVTRDEMHQALAADVRARLDRLLAACGGSGEIIVASGGEDAAIAHLVRSWSPDLVLVGSRAPHGMDRRGEAAPHDVLIVQSGRPSLAGRLINALSAAL